VALDYAESGFSADALRVLDLAARETSSTALGQVQVAPLVQYHRALLLERLGATSGAAEARAAARAADARHCLPSRLADVAALEAALRADAGDATAAALLGSWYYDKGRYHDAIAVWRRALDGNIDAATSALVNRNLGIAAYNVLSDTGLALASFEEARAALPRDAKLLYEQDQLRARTGATEAQRLATLEAERELVASRDDLTVVLANLLVAVGRAPDARDLVLGRQFQPWEGGEGQVLAAWDRTMIALAASALHDGDAAAAADHIRDALRPPLGLGEARHPLANAADLYWLLGEARAAMGADEEARNAWRIAAEFSGDFLNMSEQPFSVQTAYSVRALRRLGEEARADALMADLRDFTATFAVTPAKVDYFATSLPSMLLFHDDPNTARDATVAALTNQLGELQTSSIESAAVAAGPQQQ